MRSLTAVKQGCGCRALGVGVEVGCCGKKRVILYSMSNRVVKDGWVIVLKMGKNRKFWSPCNRWKSDIADAYIFRDEQYVRKLVRGNGWEVVRVENLRVVDESEDV